MHLYSHTSNFCSLSLSLRQAVFIAEVINQEYWCTTVLQVNSHGWSSSPVLRIHVDGEWLHLVDEEHMNHLPAEYHCHLLEESLKVPHPLWVNLKQTSKQGCHQLPQAPEKGEDYQTNGFQTKVNKGNTGVVWDTPTNHRNQYCVS